jgi:urea transport system substrate-binding protein
MQRRKWVGCRLGRFEVLSVLGSGGMGVVLEACDTTIGRRVALKVLDERLASDASILQRFVSEARAAGRLTHPNVLTLYDVAQAEGVHFLVLELADQGSADDLLRRTGPLPAKRATEVLLQAAHGLVAAHDAGLVHRDLKPGNLLVTADGTIKLGDFGVAKYSPSDSLSLTRDGQLIGTPHYMSPEQCAGNPVDVRSDIYSLGATYYTLLTGNVPYADAESLVSIVHAHCLAERPDPTTVIPTVPPECSRIVRRAMSIKPEDRFQTIEELIAALQRWLNHGDAIPEVAPNRLEALIPRRIAIASGLLVAGGLAAAALRATGNNSPKKQPKATPVPIVPTTKPPLRIGILHSLTGNLSPCEEPVVDGYTLAIESINEQGGIDGQLIEPVSVDGQSRPSEFVSRARELILDEKVAVLFGGGSSACRRALVPLLESRNHLLVYPFTSEGAEASPNILHLGGVPSQTVLPCVQWAHSFYGCRRFYLVGSNSIRGRIISEMVGDILMGFGITPVGEAFIPPGSTNLAAVTDALIDAEPDAVLNLLAGTSQQAFVTLLEQQGLEISHYSAGMQEILPLSQAESPLHRFAVGTYFQTLPGIQNRRFIKDFRERFGARRVINSAIESAYAGVHLWAQAVLAASTTDPVEIRQAMSHQSYAAPGGPISIDAATGFAHRQSLIGEYRPDGNYEIVYRSSRALSPDSYPASRSEAEWRALLDSLHSEWGGRWEATSGSPILFH